MDTKWKIALAALGIAFVCLVVWVVQTTPDAPPAVDKIDTPAIMEYANNTISEEKDGVKVWELTAEKSIVDIYTKNIAFQNMVGHFYQKDGRTIKLLAKFGFYDTATKNVHVEGDVIVTTDDGAKLTSAKLDWLGAEYKLIATEKVNITKDDVKASGDIAESTDGFRHFKLKGHAHVVKGVQDGK
ncbi:MAG: LPS export ABC transporter periplasmic protein LptC [Selenomonadaceae bacterium]|nr:LPS export ABC transporter periplasmic protein LptC [Selenomonadaceae bacterium]